MPDTLGQEGAEAHAPNPTEIRVWREWIEDFEVEAFWDHRNKRPPERPEDLLRQRNEGSRT